MTPVIFTIGHGTRSVEDFVSVLNAYGVQRVIDIRTIPRSRHNPQFNKEELPGTLRKARIGYLHIKGLGGLRHAQKDSVNMAWRNLSFRGFADYMQSEEFRKSLERLVRLSKEKKIAIMCAESVPWRCHRSMVADALSAQGVPVRHIMSKKASNDHVPTPWMEARGGKITYPLKGNNQKGGDTYVRHVRMHSVQEMR